LSVPRYDLLSRSFETIVELPDSLASASAQLFHSCEWNFDSAVLPESEMEHAILIV
jgi:hypothetical protein